MPCCVCADAQETLTQNAFAREKGSKQHCPVVQLKLCVVNTKSRSKRKCKMIKSSVHCVRKSFFFLAIISKHICTTPFDCFEREW